MVMQMTNSRKLPRGHKFHMLSCAAYNFPNFASICINSFPIDKLLFVPAMLHERLCGEKAINETFLVRLTTQVMNAT